MFCCCPDGLVLNTPVVVAPQTGEHFFSGLDGERQVIDDIDDAIAVATANLGLMPGSSFQARVSQLAQLSSAHKTVRQCVKDKRLLLRKCMDMTL